MEKAASASDAMGDMIGAMLTGMSKKEGDTSAMSDFERERAKEKQRRITERRRKQEDVFLLRAKLVGIRRELDAEVAGRILDEARK